MSLEILNYWYTALSMGEYALCPMPGYIYNAAQHGLGREHNLYLNLGHTSSSRLTTWLVAGLWRNHIHQETMFRHHYTAKGLMKQAITNSYYVSNFWKKDWMIAQCSLLRRSFLTFWPLRSTTVLLVLVTKGGQQKKHGMLWEHPSSRTWLWGP